MSSFMKHLNPDLVSDGIIEYTNVTTSTSRYYGTFRIIMNSISVDMLAKVAIVRNTTHSI